MEKLINLLHTGGYSCTIANGGKIRTFTQRGVADLYDLLTQEQVISHCYPFGTERVENIQSAADAALTMLLELLQKSDG